MRLSGAHRDVVGNVSAQLSQRGDQQGRGGLPVHVEIAPYADALAAVDRLNQALDGEQDSRNFVPDGRLIGVRIEERLCLEGIRGYRGARWFGRQGMAAGSLA